MRKLVIVGYPEQKSFQRTLERRSGTQRLEFSGMSIPRLWSSDGKRPLAKLEANFRHDKVSLRGVTKR
jgi:hypothetical protein